jgi:hypothetical protein
MDGRASTGATPCAIAQSRAMRAMETSLVGILRPNSGRFAHAAMPIGGRAVTGPA